MPKAKPVKKDEVISVELLQELISCKAKLGDVQTTNILRAAQLTTENERLASELIIDATCKTCKVSRYQLFSGRGHGLRTTALMIVFQLHKSKMGYDERQIAELFNKDEKVVLHWLIYFGRLVSTHKEDKKVLDTHKEVLDLIRDEILKMK